MLVQRRIEQLLVGRQDYDEREWDDSAQQESANEPPERRSRKPRRHRSEEPTAAKVACITAARRELGANSLAARATDVYRFR